MTQSAAIPDATNPANNDVDGDGQLNWEDVDADGEGFADVLELGADSYCDQPLDTDEDGIPDYLDPLGDPTRYFTDDFECSDEEFFGATPQVFGWEPLIGSVDTWRTDQNGGVSAKTDNLDDSVFPGQPAGSLSGFGPPVDWYENFLLTGVAGL
ncbi:MAG: hypothetical protein ACI9MR_002939 [Myxococcota bacterium]|jgi:hypothetical protein